MPSKRDFPFPMVGYVVPWKDFLGWFWLGGSGWMQGAFARWLQLRHFIMNKKTETRMHGMHAEAVVFLVIFAYLANTVLNATQKAYSNFCPGFVLFFQKEIGKRYTFKVDLLKVFPGEQADLVTRF